MNDAIVIEQVDRNHLERVWEACDLLAQRMAFPSYFCTGEWLSSASRFIAGNERLYVLTASSSEQIRAVLPLVRAPNALGGSDFRFLGARFYPDPVGLICAAKDRSMFAAAFKEYLYNVADWDRLIIDSVLRDEMAGWCVVGEQVSVSPFLTLPAKFETLLSGFRKKKRYNLRAPVRDLIDAGGEFIEATSTADRQIFLTKLFSLHKERSVERGISSSIDDDNVTSMHKNLINTTGNARLFGLRLNGKFIAILYGFEYSNVFNYYQIAHDPEFSRYSPGSVLLFHVLELSCSESVDEFNFLQGDESYKRIWASDRRELFRIVLSRNSWRSVLFGLIDRLKKVLKLLTRKISRGN